MKKRLLVTMALPLLTGLVSCEGLGTVLEEAIKIATTDLSGTETYQDYDENGYPIYGYDGDYPVYGYDADNNPIYDVNDLSEAVQVPDWEPTGSAADSGSYAAVYNRATHRSRPPQHARNRHQGGLRGSSRRRMRPSSAPEYDSSYRKPKKPRHTPAYVPPPAPSHQSAGHGGRGGHGGHGAHGGRSDDRRGGRGSHDDRRDDRRGYDNRGGRGDDHRGGRGGDDNRGGRGGRGR